MVQCNMKGSTMLTSADLSAALQLTRAGRLMDATRAIQAALGGGMRHAEPAPVPPVAPWSDPEAEPITVISDITEVAESSHATDADVADVEFRELPASEPILVP